VSVIELEATLRLAAESLAVMVNGPFATRPDSVNAVKVATPLASVCTEVAPSVPELFTLSVIVTPATLTALPCASSTVTLTVPREPPLATVVDGAVVKTNCVAGPYVKACSDAEADEAADVSDAAFVAVTVNVYDVPGVSPVKTQLVVDTL
jgi:hypothetical protein